MIFTEFRFLFFFLIAFSVFWLLHRNGRRKFWLLLCSYVFYGAWDWRFLSLIFISTVVDYIVGVKLFQASRPTHKKQWLLVSLIANLGILGFFKYFNFFIESTTQFFGFLGIPLSLATLNIVLPVGISFYTFQTMSYSLDIYSGKLKPVKTFLDFALYVSFFPQLVAGPIVRASTFLPQLEEPRKFEQVHFKACLMIFLIGFIKKACISDRLSPIVDQFFAAPDTYTASSAWMGVLFYAVQIYCDFSGYSDMAIACAGFLGYKLCLNFDFPYFAGNITSFWRRWHISLSTWLRDYLYIPLGGNRGTKLFIYKNLMLTMLLGGLWHGAGWNFIIWGALHGGALIVHREWQRSVTGYKSLSTVMKVIGPLLTFYWVCLTWIFFRSTDFHTATIVFKSFVFFDSPGSHDLGIHLLWILVILSIVHFVAYQQLWKNWWEKAPDWVFAVWYGVAVSIAILFVAPNYSAFIYFQF